jgi:hypothetical protein
VLQANQAGNSNFNAATQVLQSFTVRPARLETPAAPTVIATNNTLKSLDISWQPVAGAVTYTLKLYGGPTLSRLDVMIVDLEETSTRVTRSEFANIADGTNYAVTIQALADSEDRHSLESSKSATVTTNSPAVTPSIATQPTSQAKTAGQSVTFSVAATASDSGTLSYQWRKNGSNIANATSASFQKVYKSKGVVISQSKYLNC